MGCHFLVCFRLVTMAKNAASATAGQRMLCHRVPKLQPSASSATMTTESAAEAISPEEAGRSP